MLDYYHGVEVVIKQSNPITGDPLRHPVDVATIGAKVYRDGEMIGAWVSVAQIVSILAETFGHDIPYKLREDETELKRIGAPNLRPEQAKESDKCI